MIDAIATMESAESGEPASQFPTLPHIRVGRVAVEQRTAGSSADMATIKRLYRDAVSVAGSLVGQRADRGEARRHRGADDDRRSRAGRGREPDGAARADRAQELRQLHVHAHGERLDPDDGSGARPRRRGAAAARIRTRRADARHREGTDAARDPQQARRADRRRVRHHEAPHGGRRRDAAPNTRRARRWRPSSPSSITCGSMDPVIRMACRAAA